MTRMPGTVPAVNTIGFLHSVAEDQHVHLVLLDDPSSSS